MNRFSADPVGSVALQFDYKALWSNNNNAGFRKWKAVPGRSTPISRCNDVCCLPFSEVQVGGRYLWFSSEATYRLTVFILRQRSLSHVAFFVVVFRETIIVSYFMNPETASLNLALHVGVCGVCWPEVFRLVFKDFCDQISPRMDSKSSVKMETHSSYL